MTLFLTIIIAILAAKLILMKLENTVIDNCMAKMEVLIDQLQEANKEVKQ